MDGVGDNHGQPDGILLWILLVGGHTVLFGLALVWFWATNSWPDLSFSDPVRFLTQGFALTAFLITCVLAADRALPQQIAVLNRTMVEFWGSIGINLSFPVILGLSLMAGLAEEIFFRGALQTAFISWSSVWVGVFAASLIFGLGHALSWYYFLFTFGFGLIFGVAYVWFGDLRPVILAHFVYDIWAFLRLRRLIRQRDAAQTQS